ncbi:MAG: ribbon-helix-helix domain-containing protein [Thiobacillus sp.]|nr:ribbon-helix-helix domain-containing protein [Thiobacillus sp.]
MNRTQIYLTEQEQAALRTLAAASGRSQSELIREAVDHYLSEAEPQVRRAAVMDAAGLWKERDDLPDLARLRTEWERQA